MDRRPAVLVVDDEQLNRALIRATLSGFCELAEAGTGDEALGEHDFDLVLLDVMMPGMDGYETCRRIQEVRCDLLPVILVTALGEQEEKNRGLESGADDFLVKPVDRRELLLRTRAFLRLREQVPVQARDDVEMALAATGTALGRLEEALQVRLLEEGRLTATRTPLGLYLVKLVAEAHGGTAQVEDRQGGGSVFRRMLEAA